MEVLICAGLIYCVGTLPGNAETKRWVQVGLALVGIGLFVLACLGRPIPAVFLR